MSKIFCIGEALIDMICTDKGLPLTTGENFLKKPGGAPTNVAAAIAALGEDVVLAAKVGIDPFGQHLIDVMKGFNVDTSYMLQDAQHFTTFAFVSLLENGERDFYFNRGADGQLHWTDIASYNLASTSIVHFGSATAFMEGPLQETYFILFDKAVEQGIFTSFDPNYRHLLFKDNQPHFIKQSWYFIERCNFFKVSDEEALLLTGCADVESACAIFQKRTKGFFAITIGKEGTIFGTPTHTEIIKSIEVNPIDTTGAGDAFVGAVLSQLNKFSPAFSKISIAQWQTIIYNGNVAGAKTCEHYGAMEALKHLNSNIFNA